MKTTRWDIATLALAIALDLAACGGTVVQPTAASSTVYVRADSDATTVVTPTVTVAAAVGDALALDASWSIDAWTGASIDVVTAATPAISEERQEATVAASYRIGDLTLDGSYRYSTEPDYWSHGVVLGGAMELAQRNTTLSLAGLGSLDQVGRAGDPGFREGQQSLGGRFALTQVLDRASIAEVSLETTRLGGFQSSPYRWVAIGGEGMCAGDAPYCLPEHVPGERYRQALAARARRALGDQVSLGLEYRFYFDTWGIQSHAAQSDIAWQPRPPWTLAARYRYYTQDEAGFYRPRYAELAATDGFVTRDRKLSAFYTHELGLSGVREIALGETVLVVGLRSSVAMFDYLAFVGLSRVYAVEATATVGVEID